MTPPDQAEDEKTAADEAVAGENFSNEIGNGIYVQSRRIEFDQITISITGPNSLSENIITEAEARALQRTLSKVLGIDDDVLRLEQQNNLLRDAARRRASNDAAAILAAEQRGAEQMRERCAHDFTAWADGALAKDGLGALDSRYLYVAAVFKNAARAIRALTIPAPDELADGRGE